MSLITSRSSIAALLLSLLACGGTAVTAPQITAQPAAATVVAGNNATFSVTASGGSLSYQWKASGNAIAGATAAAYTTAAATAADDHAVYSVTISNSAGTVTSGGAARSRLSRRKKRARSSNVMTSAFVSALLMAIPSDTTAARTACSAIDLTPTNIPSTPK